MFSNPCENSNDFSKRVDQWRRDCRRQARKLPPRGDIAGFADAAFFLARHGNNPIVSGVPLSDEITPLVQYIFECGQCHALAMAIHELLGFPVYGVYRRNEDNRWEAEHYVAHCPSGLDIDIDGLRCTDWHIRKVSAKRLMKNWDERGLLPPAMKLARHYAPILIKSIEEERARTGYRGMYK